MFNNPDFYPTPASVIDLMLQGIDFSNTVVLEPSAGSGNIVTALQNLGAREVIACENDQRLKKIVQTHCQVIADDFLTVESSAISHINYIVMNPPFSKGAEHILHAYKIAPEGCKIIALCNWQTIKNTYTKTRQELAELVEMYGNKQNLGDCFSEAERKTGVEIGLIRLEKPGQSYESEFEGFFMDEEPEEQQANGLIQYNVIRDLVNRYVESVKIYDKQLETAAQLNEIQSDFFDHGKTQFTVNISRGDVPVKRNQFKKEMQKAGWLYIINKLDLNKYATRQLKDDINKFVEQQEKVPFTMRNVYRMLEIIVATAGQRMDKVLLEVFDKVTSHHHDNRQGLHGWKTNSHYLLTKRFILPSIVEMGYSGQISCRYSAQGVEMLEDLTKALCYLTGKNYDDVMPFDDFIRAEHFLKIDGNYVKSQYYGRFVTYSRGDTPILDREIYPNGEIVANPKNWGEWFEWEFFKIRVYKKGTAHIEFKDEKTWSLFNQRVAKLKGYPLPEQKEQTAYQQKQNGRKPEKKAAPKKQPVVLSTIQLKVI